MRKYTLNRAGNLDDVKNSIKCGWDKVSVEALKAALKDEKKNQKRSLFIKLIESAIKRKEKEIAVEKSIVRTIHFEDHHQDFLRWHLDAKDRVVLSEPFQTHIWKGMHVHNARGLKPGDLVDVGHLTIKYPVEKMEVRNG